MTERRKLTIEQVRDLAQKASSGPWDLDNACGVMRSDDGMGICRFDFEDEKGQTIYPMFFEEDSALIEAAPELAEMVLDQAEKIDELHARLQHFEGIATRSLGLHRELEVELFGEVLPVARDNGAAVHERALGVIRGLKQPAPASAEALREGFNVNGYIWVRLTRAGMDLVLSAGAGHSFQFNPKTGFYTVQLWEWMALTGPHTHLAMSEVFSVDNEIFFSEPALAAAEAEA